MIFFHTFMVVKGHKTTTGLHCQVKLPFDLNKRGKCLQHLPFFYLSGIDFLLTFPLLLGNEYFIAYYAAMK